MHPRGAEKAGQRDSVKHIALQNVTLRTPKRVCKMLRRNAKCEYDGIVNICIQRERTFR